MEKQENIEKENFIKEKNEQYGERGIIFRKEWIITPKMLIGTFVLILLSFLCMFFKLETLSVILIFAAVVWELSCMISSGLDADETRKKSRTLVNSKEKSEMDMFDIFVIDFFKKYPKKAFSEADDVDAMKSDFSTIIEYDYSVSQKRDYYYMDGSVISDISKVKIADRDGYISKRFYSTQSNSYRAEAKCLNIFLKLNLDSRLHITSNLSFSKNKREIYEENFLDAQKYIIEYDSNNFKEARENLSDEFYNQKFSEKSNQEVLEIDKFVKQKLLNILNNYNIDFYVALKDNLLRIELKRPLDRFDTGYEFLYDMEKTFDEILEIFLELERVNDNIRFSNMENDYSKIKNIIFDLDNTIIFDTEEDSEYYREALINAGFSDDYFYGIYQVIDDYDKSITEDNPYYNEQEMLDFINYSLDQNFSMEVIDGIKEVAGREWTKRTLISNEILEYLFSKYNLYIYTNYFQEVQAERIKNIGYSKYFKGIFGADKYGCKQFKKCFERVLKEINAKPEECVMIGDDKSRDIIAANNVNMKSILFDYNGGRDKKEITAKNYIIIKDMKELEKIL